MSSFQILTQAQINSLRTGGKILRACLDHTAAAVRPGITTKELDRIAETFILSHPGATPAFKGYHNFPASICTSVNDECVHGIPGDRILNEGDIVAIDGGVTYGGIYTDSCITVGVGIITPKVRTFLAESEQALETACALVAPGVHVGDLSSTIEKYLTDHGYQPVNGLTGHGLGTDLHQFPDIPNRGKAGSGPALLPNVAIAIEPITSMGGSGIKDAEDGWTIKTADGALSAHFEHTILVTAGGYEVIA